MKYTRKQLIQICIDAVVPCKEWHDRDSYSAQCKIESIYNGLCAGLKYTYTIENDRTIWINFKTPTEKQFKELNHYLNIDSREDYFEWYYSEYGTDYTPEMFDGYGIDFSSNHLSGYMPTRKRLDETKDSDWY